MRRCHFSQWCTKIIFLNTAIIVLTLVNVFVFAVNWMRIISTWPTQTSWLRYLLLSTNTKHF